MNGILQDPTQENLDEMMERLKSLQDAPHPDVALITNTVLGLLYDSKQRHLSALAQNAVHISALMLSEHNENAQD